MCLSEKKRERERESWGERVDWQHADKAMACSLHLGQLINDFEVNGRVRVMTANDDERQIMIGRKEGGRRKIAEPLFYKMTKQKPNPTRA